MEFKTHSLEETETIGRNIVQYLRPGDIVTLSGDIGVGKTAFVRGILRGLGYTGRVTSPTFAVVNEYKTDMGIVVHMDLYRILTMDALLEIGLEEYLYSRRIILIEWSENGVDFLPKTVKSVTISYGQETEDRIIKLEGKWEIKDII